MKFVAVEKAQWREVREIYLEAFPKRERKPFPILRWSARRGKVKVLAAVEDGVLQGFTAVIPWRAVPGARVPAAGSWGRSAGSMPESGWCC